MYLKFPRILDVLDVPHLKVIQVNNQVQLGGAETVVHQLRLGFNSLGHEAPFYVSHGKYYPRGDWQSQQFVVRSVGNRASREGYRSGQLSNMAVAGVGDVAGKAT